MDDLLSFQGTARVSSNIFSLRQKILLIRECSLFLQGLTLLALYSKCSSVQGKY
jgi:hypothetical protein